MASYEAIEENFELVGEFAGDEIYRPKHRCSRCSRAIQEGYTQTSEVCYFCNKGKNAVGEHVSQVFAISIYVSDAVNTDLMEEIYEVKDDFKHTDKMSDMLSWGVENHEELADFDLIVTPPSGEADASDENHMIPIGKLVSEKVNIPFRDLTYKKEDYGSQKNLSLEERLENVRGKIGCKEDTIDANRVIVIDDIATTCATISETARAMSESGASEVKGLVIARDEDLQNLEFANVIREE